jgi:glycosyltransferase involved in cell wall biosynthesis
MRTKKILIRSHTSLRDKQGLGGADRLILKLANALKESNWEVAILCPSPNSNVHQDHKFDYFEFSYSTPNNPVMKMVNMVRGVGYFREIMSNNDFDIVLDDVSHIPYLPAHFLKSKDTINAIFLHVAYFKSARIYNGTLRGSVTNFIDNSLPHLNNPSIICASPSTEQRVQNILGYSSTDVLRPCISVEDFDYNFDPNSNNLLYLGRLTKRKNVKCLLDAWEIIEEENPKYELQIAGSGYREEFLQSYAQKLGLRKVNFLGYVSEEEKYKLLRNSLIFIIPSLMEGYVTTGLEALAAGSPVVGSNTYGINDYITHGKTGFLFETDNPTALASTVNSIVQNPDDLESVAENGRRLAEEHSYEQFRKRANDVFMKLCDQI